MIVTIEGVDRSASYQPSELEAISVVLLADEGEVGSGSVPVPDTTGTQEPYAGQQFKLDVGGVVIVDGFVGALSRDRSGLTGQRLVQHHSVGDDNVLLNGYRAVGWKRPAETDRARILAFIADFLGHLSLDTTWVLNTHTVTVPAKTYTTETLFSELQDDLGKPTGKTMFIERRRFHWHLPTEGSVADIAIVSTGADYVDTFTNMSSSPPIRSKDPMDLATDVLAMNSRGQTRSATDATAAGRHDASGTRHQVLVEEPDASTALLQTIADQTLASRKAERITYEGEIGPMTAAQLERIPVGCLINVTDAVWGLTSSTQRIAAETIRYIHPDRFMVKVELGYPVRIRAKPPKTTPPVGLQRSPWVCIPTDFTVPTCSGASGVQIPVGPILAGHLGGGGGGNGATSLESVQLYDGATYQVVMTAIHATTTFENNLDMWLGGGMLGTAAFGCYPPQPSEVPVTETVVSVYTIGSTPGNICYDATIYQGSGYAGGNNDGSTGTLTVTYVSGPDPRFVGLPPCSNDPVPGQIVNEGSFVGDGSTTSYTAAFPYQPGTFRLDDNGLDWTPRVTETDPTTGAYTLDYPPPLGSTVTPSYKAAA